MISLSLNKQRDLKLLKGSFFGNFLLKVIISFSLWIQIQNSANNAGQDNLPC
jgi:hypothetical protein